MNLTSITKRVIIFTIGMVFLAPNLLADVKLPQILGSNMVLQRNEEVKIWGWADSGEKITLTFNGQKLKVKAGKDGKWLAVLAPMKAGGPFEMNIEGKNSIVLENILIGDVWLCGGQSNMEWPLSSTNNSEEAIAAANYPNIRLFNVPKNLQLLTVDDIPESDWKACTPEAVAQFSAVGYYFGKNLHQDLDVPIGLIGSNWGGTNVETWTSTEMSSTVPEMAKKIEDLSELDPDKVKKQMEEKRAEILEKIGTLEEGMIEGKPLWAEEDLDLSAWQEMKVPGAWEKQGLEGLDGVVWFRRTFVLTAEQAATDAVLSLGPIDDGDMTFINNVLIGTMKSSYDVSREYDIPHQLLNEGENTLVVRVDDQGGDGGMYGAPGSLFLDLGKDSVALAGTWKFRVSKKDLIVEVSNSYSPNEKPTLLYNGMIHPIINYALTGAIWYQGESNARNAYKYRTYFPNLIKDWRNKWNNPDMGFYFVQLANFKQPQELPVESDWAELREAQEMTLSLPETGMAVIIDIGEADDIHPRNKKDVGKRLALAALHETYGKDLVYSGPVYKSMIIEGSKLIVDFDPMGSKVVVADKYGYVKGFALAGEDQKFHWAKGVQNGNKIILTSRKVKQPVAVRYAWADNPDDANIFNTEGLPAGPFRSDDWPGLTRDR